jgi:hypothetical protein
MARIFAGVCLILLAGLAAPAAEPVPADLSKSLLRDGGELEKVRESMERVFQFTIDEGKLKIDREAWEQAAKGMPDPDDGFGIMRQTMQQQMQNDPKAAAEMAKAMAMNQAMHQMIAGMSGPTPPIMALFEGIRAECGTMGGGHGSSGTGDDARWNSSFSSDRLSGEIDASKAAEKLTLHEAQAPRRTLEFRTFNQNAFWIDLSNHQGEMISLRQEANGRFTMIALGHNAVFADQCETFTAFFKKHHDWMQAELLPALAKLGLRPLLPPDAPAVRKAVIAAILRSADNAPDGKQLVADLASTDGIAADRASKELANRYELYKSAIAQKLKEAGLSEALKSKLQAIVDQQTDSRPASNTLAALDLVHDPVYVVSLLDDVDSRELPIIAEQLSKLTGKDLGADREAWQSWAKAAVK